MEKLLAEKHAQQFRNETGFSSADPIRFKSLLKKLNIQTLFKPLGESFSGMAIKIRNPESNESYKFILVNSNHSLGKQHFTICHEIYHLMIQDDFETRQCEIGKFSSKDKEEYRADLFAANLLLPKEGVLDLIPDNQMKKDKLTLNTILTIEHYFSASRAATLYRLSEIGLLSKDKVETFRGGVKKGAMVNGYGVALYEPANHNLFYGDYGHRLKSLFDNEKISESHFLSMMNAIGIDLTESFDGED